MSGSWINVLGGGTPLMYIDKAWVLLKNKLLCCFLPKNIPLFRIYLEASAEVLEVCMNHHFKRTYSIGMFSL